MAVTQPEQFAKLIAGLADGASVSLQGTDSALWTALAAEGIVPKDQPGELLVGEADFSQVPSFTQLILTPLTGQLPEFLKRAASRGFGPDMEFEPPPYANGWMLLRRIDSPLYSRIDFLEAEAADLDAERQRLGEMLQESRRELLSVKNSPAWHLIGRYRQWLDWYRKKQSGPFRAFDRVMSRLVRTGGNSTLQEKDEAEDFGEKLIAPATRFTSTASSEADWRHVFQSLAAHAGGDSSAPRISIITPLWNTKPAWLAEAAVSIFDQTMPNWEWCIADDSSIDTAFNPVLNAILKSSARVHLTRLERNGGISEASNAALRLAQGEFVCFLDHDDLLHPEALELCLERLDQGYDAAYTDSNKTSESGVCEEPFYKPDWSPEYFRGVMYVGHLLCVRREAAIALGGFESRFNGVQDFEFFLRYTEQHPRVAHIPRILYHWRRVEGSTAASLSAKRNITQLQQRAVAEQLHRLGLNAQAARGMRPHRVTSEPKPRQSHPRVSIIIPTKDAPEMLSKCLDSIFDRSTYRNFQVICADNETTSQKALGLMRRKGVDRVFCQGKFNFSRVNNESARFADGEFLLFLNNDIEVITADWIEQMLYHAEQNDVGAVGALLLFPDRKVQHCGIALGFRGTADHILRRANSTNDGYAGSLAHPHECSAVTAACMLVRKKLFDEAGGFEERYHTAYQDVDLCLRLQAAGRRNIYTPRAVLIHHESYTRKKYYDMVDRNLLLDAWQELIETGDPFYNVNFDRQKTNYQIAADADAGEVPSWVTLWSPERLDGPSAARVRLPESSDY